jgi:hypothetical protein
MKKSKSKIREKWAKDLIEPVLSESASKSELATALTWYNVMMSSTMASKYINTYLKSNKIAKVVPSTVPMYTAAAVARLLSRGFNDPKLISYMDSWVLRLDDKPATPKSIKKVISIQERTAIKLNVYITGLDNAFENFIESDYKMKFNTEKYLMDSGVKTSYIQSIVVWASNVRNEFIESKTDNNMKEGYSNYTTPQKNKVIKFFDVMIDSLEKYKVDMAPVKKKKVRSSSKIVSKLKYLKSSPELKLKSVDPVELIGSKQVWVYNTKTKMLGYYGTNSLAGMTVTGTTLKGFDRTEQRCVKKPEEQLQKFIKSKEGTWIINFKELYFSTSMTNTIITKGNGRFNGNTIILMVF